jgi:hypothetical protein
MYRTVDPTKDACSDLSYESVDPVGVLGPVTVLNITQLRSRDSFSLTYQLKAADRGKTIDST